MVDDAIQSAQKESKEAAQAHNAGEKCSITEGVYIQAIRVAKKKQNEARECKALAQRQYCLSNSQGAHVSHPDRALMEAESIKSDARNKATMWPLTRCTQKTDFSILFQALLSGCHAFGNTTSFSWATVCQYSGVVFPAIPE